ncbi:hypothetical protein PVAND_007533 [Polypedilum vanderplanki]|uniref:C2H2-type domain-containing protein n=1 Tax=Polypedilum vanderplanki TaxID=319348 RepID=A0A9J6C834_POLVA|nr:hypothetical protein PVAND_007533 [Polypedilum vanderplanki]
MMENSCFICAENCQNSNLYLVNLETKKHKSKYPTLIGNLIKSDYELRISSEDVVCLKCQKILEKYDELDKESRLIKNILSRQIARTYQIETDAEEVYLDKSKIFTELRSNGGSNITQKYSCKHCPHSFITDNIDTVNAHIIYHRLVSEEAQKKLNSTNGNNFVKSLVQAPIAVARNTREVQKTVTSTNSKTIKSINTNNEAPQDTQPQFQIEISNSDALDMNEETLDSQIDLRLLEDEFYDSNLIRHTCQIENCKETFSYASDLIRHLKLKHKLVQTTIFSIFKSVLKRPKVMTKLTCPYCFTKTGSSEMLEQHVKHHEMAAKKAVFSERLNQFISNLMKTCRCKVCDYEMLDPTALVCNHEIAKNGMAPKIICIYCDEYFYNIKLYNNHLSLKHNHCFMCGFVCNGGKEILKDHIKSHLSHSEYACHFCDNIYQTSNNLRDHIKKNHPKQCCSYCEEWYVNQNELNHHKRFAHADKRNLEQKASFCDFCGQSFKNKTLYDLHIANDHKQKKKIYKCSVCLMDFQFRYLLMDHHSNVHERTIIDPEANFYKCCFCSKGFSSHNRQIFIAHMDLHNINNLFCYDCNSKIDSVSLLEVHRERFHQDFSKTRDKLNNEVIDEIPEKSLHVRKTQAANSKRQSTISESPLQLSQTQVASPKHTQFELVNNNINAQQTQQQQQLGQQIVLQSEDGSLLNMNNLILTENGELIIQNLDGLLPNGQENDDGTQIQISNLEQFLQGLSGNTEVSYIQPDMIQTDDGQVIIQSNEAQQGSLLETYKEIFEPNDEISNELIEGVEESESQQSQNILLNGEYLIEAPQQQKSVIKNVQPGIEHVDISNPQQQALDAANQNTLDELGDILLEVAAAADKEKKPKVSEQKALRETLWGKKRNLEQVKEPSSKRRCGKIVSEPIIENETPARDFSQAYEFFVKGFDAKKHKQL